MSRRPPSSRIRLSEALHLLEPHMSKSTFYGTAALPGPRWTMIDELDIKQGRTLTMDRKRFERWLLELAGTKATDRHPLSQRLGELAERERPTGFSETLDRLLRAREMGKISPEVLDRAIQALSIEED